MLAFSNAFKVATGDEPVSVFHGVVAARSTLTARRGAFESPYNGPVYVLDAVTNNAGAAGGIVATWDGRLVGMIGKELRNTQTNTWLNYVIPIEELRDIVGQIVSGRFTHKKTDDDEPSAAASSKKRALSYDASDFGIITIPDVVARTPAYIDRILPESLADKAGLKTNDLVLFVGDNIVQSCRALKEELGRLESGDQLTIVVRREDQLITAVMIVPKKQ